MKVTFSISHTPPDRRVITRSFSRSERARLVKVNMSVEYSVSKDGVSSTYVHDGALVQRLKQDGTDTAHRPSDEYRGIEYLTEEEYDRLAASLVREAHDYMRSPAVVDAIGDALLRAKARNTFYEPEGANA